MNRKKKEICVALSRYGVSLKQYTNQLAATPIKRKGGNIAPDVRLSPRLSPATPHPTNTTGPVRSLF